MEKNKLNDDDIVQLSHEITESLIQNTNISDDYDYIVDVIYNCIKFNNN